MMALGWTVAIYQRGMASMGRIEELFAEEAEIVDGPRTEPVAEIRGEIEFRDLTFRYAGKERPVLEGIDLRIEPRTTVAIVGPVGSGKSSLIRLIPRLYEAPPGTLFIDGRDIRTIPLKSLREAIGFVPQETFLFSDSIRENIGFGPADFSLEQVIGAARTAQIEPDIEELPERYEALLGERGVNLSGGQKQRMALARAIILEPRILLLDDCLSSVDAETEKRILSGLRTVMKERTSIIISHRISAIQDADLIVVMNDGKIVERGQHRELLTLDGLYAELYRKQRISEELERV
jgi:ATP-binding cassette subfamily B protein